MKEVTFKPLADRVLLLPDAAEEKTQSGLYLPHQAIKNPPKGRVMCFGKGYVGYEMTVNVGDHVLHAEGVGIKVVLDGTEYLLLREMEILGVL